MSKRPFLVGSLIIALISVIFILTPSPQSSLPISISFGGYSETTNGIRMATFAITNNSESTVWKGGAYHDHPEKNWSFNTPVSTGGIVMLSPGQTAIALVPAPDNLGQWRAAFIFVHDGWGFRLDKWCQEKASRFFDAIVPDMLRSTSGQVVFSDWIER